MEGCPPAETFTFTWPFGDTRPETLTAAPPRYETELPRIIKPYRYDWSQPPLLVMTSTLHGPSNDAASADGVAARALAAKAATLADPVDIVMVHDPTEAPELADAAPLILAGHVHERQDQQLDDDTELLVQGSTGGAGLRALESEQPTPLTFTVLYFNRNTGLLQARDEITLGGLGTSSAEVTRILSPTEPSGRTP